jgi:acyl-CoA hydrolase
MGNCGLNVDREFDDAFSSVGPTTPSKSPARKQSLSSSLIPTGVSESRVHFYELVSQHHTDSRGIVLAGHILRWMDICACQSAEKHGSLSSVTLSMDDLTFDKPIYAGSTVEM